MKTKDDYDWSRYTRTYLWEIDHIRKDEQLDFLVQKSHVEGNELVFEDPLHENWKELYFQIHRLRPRSVLECGCGGCYHLYNIRKLMPDVEVNGCDLLASQIETAAAGKLQVPEDIRRRVIVTDFSEPAAPVVIGRKFDLIYSHAVIMHLQHAKAVQFLKNMMELAGQYVLLVENPALNDFPAIFADAAIESHFTRSPANRFVPFGVLWTRKAP